MGFWRGVLFCGRGRGTFWGGSTVSAAILWWYGCGKQKPPALGEGASPMLGRLAEALCRLLVGVAHLDDRCFACCCLTVLFGALAMLSNQFTPE